MLCRGCGNEIEPGADCPVCATRRRQAEAGAGQEARFCSGCGNVIHGAGTCPICESGRGSRRRKEQVRTRLCPGCGNEVEDFWDCPICRDGRAVGRSRKGPRSDGPTCPQCRVALEPQDWDGVAVHVCPDCGGALFEPGGLDRTLDKLRGDREPHDLAEILAEFRERRGGTVGRAVRYRPCPACGTIMVRRNYADASGILIDVCIGHGTWTDQTTFGELSDFVSRGGDEFVARSPLKRQR